MESPLTNYLVYLIFIKNNILHQIYFMAQASGDGGRMLPCLPSDPPRDDPPVLPPCRKLRYHSFHAISSSPPSTPADVAPLTRPSGKLFPLSLRGNNDVPSQAERRWRDPSCPLAACEALRCTCHGPSGRDVFGTDLAFAMAGGAVSGEAAGSEPLSGGAPWQVSPFPVRWSAKACARSCSGA
jgi:hypothetical protein